MNALRITCELIFHNAEVITLVPSMPTAQAVAIGGGKILAVGSDETILQLAGATTKKIDLGGRVLIPGFIDTHIHFHEWAVKRRDLSLAGLASLEELLAEIHRAAGERPAGQWILGQGWNETDWAVPRMPVTQLLDQVAPHHPVMLWRCDLHLAVANSAALSLAGIGPDAPDPPGGRFERDATGALTGILRESAINMLRRIIPPLSREERFTAYREASAALHRRGVTAIHDIRLMSDRDGAKAFATFQQLDREDRLQLRTWVTFPDSELDHLIDLGLRTGFGNERLRTGHIKFFADGGVGARTGWMIDPYLDSEGNCGMPLVDMAEMAQKIERAEHAGLSVMIHAIGDRANRELVGVFENIKTRRARSGRPQPAIPHRLEHAQMMRPEDIDRLADLDLVINVTPANLLADINLIDRVVGKNGRWAYNFRKLLDSGAPVMFSSDCPVCDPAPLLGMHAAVTRERPDGTPAGGWHPENRVSVIEAIRAYTTTPAVAHKILDLGSIAPGMRADLVVLSENILTIPLNHLLRTKVEMTVFDGRIVHQV